MRPEDLTAAESYNAWAAFYDALEGDRAQEVAFYAGLAPPGAAVCELGCGTGAVLAPVAARLGAQARAAGVDGSSEMLARARQRAPAIDWRLGDMRAPPLDGPFDLVFCARNTVQVLLEDADLAAMLGAARGLLGPGGRVAFDLYQPNPAWLAQPFADRPGRRAVVDGRELEVRETQHYDAGARVLHLDWRLVPRDAPGTTLATLSHAIRQYEAARVLELVAGAGLRVLQRLGDVDGRPFDAASRKQVLVCADAGA